jgi:hypothetical protein
LAATKAIVIRRKCEDRKATAQRFVIACEQGHYRLKKK